MENGKRIEKVNFGYLDLETTGLFPHLGNRVCEVGFVEARLGEEKGNFHSLVNPMMPISYEAALVNGITDEMLKDAPLFGELAKKLCGVMERVDAIVAHNAPFDLGFLSTEFKRISLDLPERPVIDTLLLARRCFQFPSNSLGNIARALDIKAPVEHRALADVRTTKRIFEIFLERLEARTLDEVLSLQGGDARLVEEELPTPEILKDAITKKKRVRIKYLSASGEESRRIIEPIQAAAYGNWIYVLAFCHLKAKERVFRLDRIVEINSYEED